MKLPTIRGHKSPSWRSLRLRGTDVGESPPVRPHPVVTPPFVQRSPKTGGFEGPETNVGLEDDTIQDDSIYTSGSVAANTTSERISVANTEQATNSTSRSIGVSSSATTVQMGTTQLNARRRKNKVTTKPVMKNYRPPKTGPMWRRATEAASDVSPLPPDGENSSTGSPPIQVEISNRSEESSVLPKRRLKLVSPSTAASTSASSPMTSSGVLCDSKQSTSNEESRVESSQDQELPSICYRFEFGDVVTNTPQKVEDDEVSGCLPASVYSFSFSQDDEGTGFELDEFQDLAAQPDEKTEESNDSEKDLSTASSSFDMGPCVNMTDKDLMERCSSPGAIRLTAEGLSKHEKVTFKKSLQAEQPSDPFEAWKQDKAKRWIQKQKLERQRDQSQLRSSQLSEEPATTHKDFEHKETKENVLAVVPKRLSFRQKPPATSFVLSPVLREAEEGLANFSITPQKEAREASMEAIPLAKQQSEPIGINKLFRKRDSRAFVENAASRANINKLQSPNSEKKSKEAFRLEHEQKRIAQKRQAYLDAQRAREGLSKEANKNRSIRGKRSSSKKEVGETSKGERSPLQSAQQSSVSSGLAALPPCVVCHTADRTHIATPCMHFSFCSACAIRLDKQASTHCPVCFEANVTFAAVSV